MVTLIPSMHDLTAQQRKKKLDSCTQPYISTNKTAPHLICVNFSRNQQYLYFHMCHRSNQTSFIVIVMYVWFILASGCVEPYSMYLSFSASIFLCRPSFLINSSVVKHLFVCVASNRSMEFRYTVSWNHKIDSRRTPLFFLPEPHRFRLCGRQLQMSSVIRVGRATARCEIDKSQQAIKYPFA